MHIRHLKHTQIRKELWDCCIANASNSLPYAYSWYLDAVSPGWEALIAGEYEYVMPLTVKRKFGIPYIMQPMLTQQSGIFSEKETNEKITASFIRKIPYLSYHINLNAANHYEKSVDLPNYILNLDKEYPAISAGFSKNTKRNITKAREKGLFIRQDVTLEEFLDFYFRDAGQGYIKPRHGYTTRLLQNALQHGNLTCWGAFNEKNEPVSMLGLLTNKNRLFYLLPDSNTEGKAVSAMFLIIDTLIRQYAGTPVILDFEGSKTESIARFYKGFGSVLEPYYELKHWSMDTLIKRIK